jgi:hypothetical protein
MIEHRICWNASSNASFHGASDWEPWDDENATQEDVEKVLSAGGYGLPLGLSLALEYSGFDWYAEIREIDSDAV